MNDLCDQLKQPTRTLSVLELMTIGQERDIDNNLNGLPSKL